MKKTFGGIVAGLMLLFGAFFAIVFGGGCAESIYVSGDVFNAGVLSRSEQETHAQHNSNNRVVTDLSFIGATNRFRMFDYSRGILINRNNHVEHSPHDIFVGQVLVDNSPPFAGWHNFRFEPVLWEDGMWVGTNTLVINEFANGLGVEYELRKILPAGLYGIRLTMLNPDGSTYIMGGERGEAEASMVFQILYADNFSELSVTNNARQTVQNVRAGGVLGRNIELSFIPNAGAIDMAQWNPAGNRNGHTFGNLYMQTMGMEHSMISLADEDVTIQAFFNRSNVTEYIPMTVLNDGTLVVSVPQSLSEGRLSIHVTHPANPNLVGVFVFDNATTNVFAPGGMGTASIVLVVFGTIFATGALVLFTWPKVVVAMQNKKYKEYENDRYMTRGEGAKNDRKFKAQSARDAKRSAEGRVVEDMQESGGAVRGKSFLETVRENRAKREAAREAGLTMDEFREQEAKQKKVQDARSAGLGSFRRAIDEKLGNDTSNNKMTVEEVIPEKQSTIRVVDGVEFDALDSHDDVRFDNVNAGAQAASGDETPSGILSRLRGLVD